MHISADIEHHGCRGGLDLQRVDESSGLDETCAGQGMMNTSEKDLASTSVEPSQAVCGSLLIFPVNIDASATWVTTARALGYRVIGASSEPTDPGIYDIDALEYLPYITSPEFNASLQSLVSQEGITRIYTAHQGVWAHLDYLLPLLFGSAPALGPQLCRPHPHAVEYREVDRSIQWGRYLVEEHTAECIAEGQQPVAKALSIYQYAGLHRQFVRTPGQCDEDKLRALCSLMRLAPKGDIVEIGSLYGRSALALASLAGYYEIGTTVCVDPWGFAHARDQGEKATILNGNGINIDFEGIFRNFLVSASQVKNLGYIRLPSEQGIEYYRQAVGAGQLFSKHLSPSPLTGSISLLHIDGNHAYESVAADVQAWLPMVVKGGWLLLDDYLWAFGDGPRRVGDELLSEGGFDCAFVFADTLFLRKASS